MSLIVAGAVPVRDPAAESTKRGGAWMTLRGVCTSISQADGPHAAADGIPILPCEQARTKGREALCSSPVTLQITDGP